MLCWVGRCEAEYLCGVVVRRGWHLEHVLCQDTWDPSRKCTLKPKAVVVRHLRTESFTKPQCVQAHQRMAPAGFVRILKQLSKEECQGGRRLPGD